MVNDLGPSVPQVQEVGAVMGPSIFPNHNHVDASSRVQTLHTVNSGAQVLVSQ